MLRFDSDYMEGAHPRILERLMETNMEQTAGYGSDPHTGEAKARIRAACAAPDAAVWLLVGGTQANRTAITSLLRPWQGVVGADSAHIAVHEAGAIENGGHKVIALPGHDGRLDAADLERCAHAWARDDNREHMVQPGMAYLSFATEFGTLYSLAELEAIAGVCRRHGMLLFVDGARLGYGLAAEGNDVSLPDIARLADAFTIGGTKQGALFGEALVISRPDGVDCRGMFPMVKQSGALLAKGRLLGIQFDTLLGNGVDGTPDVPFADSLYMRLSRHADALAMRVRDGLRGLGMRMFVDSPTNQQFAVVDRATRARLDAMGVGYGFLQSAGDGHDVIRFCTSWATDPRDVDALLGLLDARRGA